MSKGHDVVEVEDEDTVENDESSKDGEDSKENVTVSDPDLTFNTERKFLYKKIEKWIHSNHAHWLNKVKMQRGSYNLFTNCFSFTVFQQSEY